MKIFANVMKALFRILGKLVLIAGGAFVISFIVYMTNAENKVIYYVVRPFLNKHYDKQVRNRGI